ncbi:AtpZ/AtpI family protein [Chthonobacter rhizosphaerae]|uniref:AtpZ/AtpI family protein n=1 Tax=Chthonobacter rhizosphaerae TaxID=2735553 RepID=UPI0015EF674C|nr:AtpZ/AtpI family protein [Chthonobacter rhizosphaerae]
MAEDKAPKGERIDARLHELRQRLDAEKLRDAERRGGRQGANNSGLGQALKLGSEFVAGVLVGTGIGYAIDYYAGTSPWGMIVFLLLGFAAGVLNVMRAAGMVAEPDPHRFKRRRDDNET